jgi:chromosome segregation ATPase
MIDAETKPDALAERAAARQALADAIAGVDEERRRAGEAKRAVETGWNSMVDAGNRLEALKAKLPQLANTPAADAVLSALATGSAVEARSPRALAEDEIRVLEESREQLRRALETGEREVAQRKNAIVTAEAHVKRMAAAVLRASGATERLLEGLLDLERQVVERRLGLAFLLRHGAVPVADKAAVERILDGYGLPTRAASSDHSGWGRHPVTNAWEAALKALATDPDARLPD